ncbi:MAG: hypothetical protein WBC44_02070 [Planctomycetaceae bacterium]
MTTKRKRMNVYTEDDITVMDLGSMDIWDGADLALIRDTLTVLVLQEGRRRIGIDMAHVKYIPSGYFGMLFDWKERGVEVFLLDPQPAIRKMLWFRQFAEPIRGAIFRLTEEIQEELRQEGVGHWQDDLPEAEYAAMPAWPAR